MSIQIRHTQFIDDYELTQLVELQNYVYKHRNLTFSEKGFKFWYKQNPVGNVVSYSAFDGEKMVAHYACIPTQLLIEERIVNGVLSMAVVTHPDYRGKGLFKTLAQKTYELAQELGYEFVIGVANANSFPGFMKYFPFTYVGQLDVKWGWGKIEVPKDKTFSHYWDVQSLKWRLENPKYSKHTNNIYGTYGNYPLIKTYMGQLSYELLNQLNLRKTIFVKRPLTLYVGMGAKLSKWTYFKFPKFVKHSPFHLRFMDITKDQHLPQINKENIVFQLIDFDVA